MLPFVRVASAWSNTAPFSFGLTFSHISSVTPFKNRTTYIYQSFHPQRSSTLLHNQKYGIFVTHSKNRCKLYAVSFLFLLFIYFLLCITGYHLDPVRRLRRASNAAGGGGPRLAVPPSPRHD